MESKLLNGCLASALLLSLGSGSTTVTEMTQILGRPTDRSITLSVLSPNSLEAFVEYGTRPGAYTGKTAAARTEAGRPIEILVGAARPGPGVPGPNMPLKPDTRYYYRLRHRQAGQTAYLAGAENSFHTQRAPGAMFSFGVQGDSHPERLDRMYRPELYQRTMENVRQDDPDFYILLGDDFSTDHLYNRNDMTADSVAQLYINQRRFLGIPGGSTPVFLVNGNHEHAARYLVNGSATSPAVLAGRARNIYFPLPAPDGFYSGDAEAVEHVGLRRDYYAWTWGDALFVAIDPYWHSPVQIDSGLGGQGGGKGGGGRKGERKGERKGGERRGEGKGDGRSRDGWVTTMGDAQYQWFKRTLEQSKARYKFVFAHHVLGTGRGAVEVADLWEWGGRNRSGEWEFDKKRPGWELPVHQLMVKHGVTIFFQGHDHLFARQQKDGVVYQEVPNPADNTYTAFNREAYRSGDILPNSGYLRVTVAPAGAKVDYIRSYLPKDETPEHKQGEIAFSYRAGKL